METGLILNINSILALKSTIQSNSVSPEESDTFLTERNSPFCDNETKKEKNKHTCIRHNSKKISRTEDV